MLSMLERVSFVLQCISVKSNKLSFLNCNQETSVRLSDITAYVIRFSQFAQLARQCESPTHDKRRLSVVH